jgi:hypothetical protein
MVYFDNAATGGLIVGQRVDETQIDPLMRGGTGGRSEHEVHAAIDAVRQLAQEAP